MTSKIYLITPAKVGNQHSFRLPRAFSKDYPHLANASGHIEVLSENTLLVRLDTSITKDETQSLIMSLFLDALIKDARKNPSRLVPYTQ